LSEKNANQATLNNFKTELNEVSILLKNHSHKSNITSALNGTKTAG